MVLAGLGSRKCLLLHLFFTQLGERPFAAHMCRKSCSDGHLLPPAVLCFGLRWSEVQSFGPLHSTSSTPSRLARRPGLLRISRCFLQSALGPAPRWRFLAVRNNRAGLAACPPSRKRFFASWHLMFAETETLRGSNDVRTAIDVCMYVCLFVCM